MNSRNADLAIEVVKGLRMCAIRLVLLESFCRAKVAIFDAVLGQLA